MRPRKRFGQHFLEAAWADKVVDAIDPAPTDCFVEIGPGPGALTLRLARRVARLTAIEIDRDLAAQLTRSVPGNTQIVVGDIVDQDFAALAADGPIRVAGNLPYNVASPILFSLLGCIRRGAPIVDATIMLQVEMAERLIAKVGTHEYGVLTILVGLRADLHHLLALPPGAFRPMPKVRSALVRLTFRPPAVALADEGLFERLVRSLFMHRRKMLANALRPVADEARVDPVRALRASGIDPRRRPETLQLAELARLVQVLASADATAVL
ncbi:MAG TPA: 16S rRNA (adenine(1518)-N(6)/adenine(1519)-N(6))-dimethyltransferase RsmA [Vicinamibacterales bacterium]|jgi:16S rRNA (adenine1518-N6/adenine1519-N6)-dimethyltransferase